MNIWLGLLQNEQLKLYRRMGTWVMFILLLMAIVGIAFITKYVLPIAASEGASPLLYFMNVTVPLFGLITLFAIIVAATSVANEFSQGTIKLLLIRPIHRAKILLAKYIAVLLFSMYMIVVLFLGSLVLGGVLFGFEGLWTNPGGDFLEDQGLSGLLQQYAFESIPLVMMVTFAFMVAAVFTNSALAIGLSMFLMFTGGQLAVLLSQYPWVKWILFAHFDLRQYVDGLPLVEGMTLSFSLLVLSMYYILFILVTWLTFIKRDITA
ncbi:ABC-2 type transport system permease protein [Caldalkalibacillus uzonensis]|uniref:ABC-2 type transport system permease protein n=1 Tax=Caldalkalibacillus uzonensis TaxID=353224 RepID=A0ABU0CWC0_9BACI|nr:ABC transporter permease [Caldalkalibacillus uzonensis]MDQ0340720.1 ABC-2 type transport system permease protein [Caldalkalibacillus uzonensis]